MFVDEATIEVKGGDGGNGIVAFRREKYMPMGGPSGGDGGSGGNVIIFADAHRKTLIELSRQRHHKGERGRHGEGSRRKGRGGKDVLIPVPIGTQIFNKETKELLADLKVPNQKYIVARGGMGGRGNPHFSSAARHAPKFAEMGGKGEELTVLLTLKLLADVALIGLPNAGKSTLISSISAAKPKIADYPFTTLTPNLGVVKLDAAHIFVAADIPGLIRGAHKGSGLGHQFLKHIERAPVFVHLVDPLQPNAFRNFLAINRELKMWKRELIDRPQLVALTKADLIDEETRPQVDAIKERFISIGCEVFEISAATHIGLEPLIWRAMHYVEIERERIANEPTEEPVILTKAQIDKPLEIKEIARFADGQSEWEVTGGPLERLLGRFDMDNSEARLYVHRILERNGILTQMQNAGVKYGDLVHLDELAFEFQE
jgi:GTP-binding protein